MWVRLWGCGCSVGLVTKPTLYSCEAALHRDYERGCELALEAQLPLLNNQLCDAHAVLVFYIKRV